MDRIDRVLERLASALGRVAELALLGLILVTLNEVAARYVFNRPQIWSYDVAYMLSGAMVMLGAAWALRANAHVRIDVFAQALPARWQQGLQVIMYVFLFLPALGFATWAAWGRTSQAWRTGQLEQVSAWAPKVWPFYLIIALGLTALFVECLAAVLRHLRGWRERRPVPGGGL
ncbi:MAG: TRAP transporter small permease subunit [Geminicoccaceae bacterium]|nr:MAG: TRAP transporter small permease subunit [Geminicoccaceae bacterium]